MIGQDGPVSGAAPAAHFHFLDGLRGLAALWVVLFHLTVSTTLPPPGGQPGTFLWEVLFGNGGLGVAVFFVLSGFVISHSLRRGLGSVASVRTFAVRRVIRLTPPYWSAIVVAVVVHGVAARVNGEPFSPGGYPLSVGRVSSHLVYIQSLVGQPHINDVFWTLALEMQFYLVLAVFLVAVHLFCRRWPGALRPLAWVAGAGTLAAARLPGEPQVVFWPLLYSFVLGAFIYWLYAGWVGRVELLAYLAGLGILFAVRPDAFLATSILIGLAIIVATFGPFDGMTTWLSQRPFRWLGRVSYSLYLVHVPVQGAVLLLTVKVLGDGAVGVVAASVASTAACLVASWMFWWAVERPSIDWSASLRRRPEGVDRAGPDGASSTVAGSVLGVGQLAERSSQPARSGTWRATR